MYARIFSYFILFLIPLQGLVAEGENPSQMQVVFTPPEGWRLAESATLPKSVKVMVVGEGSREYPPSMNLGTEPFQGTLKQYLKIVKEINESQKSDWKDLGMIKTDAGDASLSQVDIRSEWGPVRMMHVILIKDGTVYILTAAALRDEFSDYYKEFFKALKSLKFERST